MVVCKLPAADTFVGRVKDSVLRARESLSYAQARMCETADAKRRAEAFEVGEFALLSTKGLKLSPLATKKLLDTWLGPFEVIKRVGEVAYKVSLPASMSRIHPVIQDVSLLRKYKDGGRVSSPPAVLLDGVRVVLHQFSSVGKVTVTEPFTMFRPHTFPWHKILKLMLFLLTTRPISVR